jgi:hypothetical protein
MIATLVTSKKSLKETLLDSSKKCHVKERKSTKEIGR